MLQLNGIDFFLKYRVISTIDFYVYVYTRTCMLTRMCVCACIRLLNYNLWNFFLQQRT